MYPQKVGSLIYLLIFIIRPTKGCDERAITAPLPAKRVQKAACQCGTNTTKIKMAADRTSAFSPG